MLPPESAPGGTPAPHTREEPRQTDALPDVCPACRTPTVRGYGLMGGGIGPYVFCPGACDFFAKVQDEEATP